MNITAVPGFILALSESNNPLMVKGLVYIRGAQPFRVFQKEIEQALSGL
jgi:predicted DsbA family dithiol-disulfide isomerase